jgi:hypothetical protein
MTTRTRQPTRCKVCGGTHTPKCRPSHKADVAVWRGILSKWRQERKDKQAQQH